MKLLFVLLLIIEITISYVYTGYYPCRELNEHYFNHSCFRKCINGHWRDNSEIECHNQWSLNAHLTSIHSYDEDLWIYNNFLKGQTYDNLWIGLDNDAEEGKIMIKIIDCVD